MSAYQPHHEHPTTGDPRTASGVEQGHAPEGTSVPIVYTTAAALSIVIVLSLGAVWALMRVFTAIPYDASRARSQQRWLEAAPAETKGLPPAGQVLAELRARDHRLLDHYSWIDQATGRARLPIDRAMQLLVEHPRLANGLSANHPPESPDSAQEKQP